MSNEEKLPPRAVEHNVFSNDIKQSLYQELYSMDAHIKLNQVYWSNSIHPSGDEELLTILATNDIISNPSSYTSDNSLVFKSIVKMPIVKRDNKNDVFTKQYGYSCYTIVTSLLDDELKTRSKIERALIQPHEWRHNAYYGEDEIRFEDLKFNTHLFVCDPNSLDEVECRGDKCRKRGENDEWCTSCNGTFSDVYNVTTLFKDDISIRSFAMEDILYISKTFERLDLTNEADIQKYLKNLDITMTNAKQEQLQIKEFDSKLKAVVDQMTRENQEKRDSLSDFLTLQLSQEVYWDGDIAVASDDGKATKPALEIVQAIQTQLKQELDDLQNAKRVQEDHKKSQENEKKIQELKEEMAKLQLAKQQEEISLQEQIRKMEDELCKIKAVKQHEETVTQEKIQVLRAGVVQP